MASLEQLSALGKAVMSAAVEAEMLGLYGVRPYLDSAFDEVVVEARRVREREALEELEAVAREYEKESIGGQVPSHAAC